MWASALAPEPCANTTTLLPVTLSSTSNPGCYCLRVSEHSLAHSFCITQQQHVLGPGTTRLEHRMAKVMWGEAACLDSHGQQIRGRKQDLAGGGFNSQCGNWLILPAPSRAQAALTQICQHLPSALVLLKSKEAFVERLMKWGSRRELHITSMLVSDIVTETNPESGGVFLCFP